MGVMVGAGVLVGLIEIIAPRTAIRLRTRLTARDSGLKAQLRDAFDETFHTESDDPRAVRNVRWIGTFLVPASLLVGWVWLQVRPG